MTRRTSESLDYEGSWWRWQYENATRIHKQIIIKKADILNETITEIFTKLGKAEMENEVWQEVFGDRGEISTRESYQESIVCGVCGNDKSKTARNKEGKTVCETTEKYCKENKTI